MKGMEMKYKTLKNMERATQLISAKGYDWKSANDIAIQCFDNSRQNGMPVEWFINNIVSNTTTDETVK